MGIYIRMFLLYLWLFLHFGMEVRFSRLCKRREIGSYFLGNRLHRNTGIGLGRKWL